jgi:hypothetical protein
VNTPHSRRFAKSEVARQTRQRVECGDFSTAFVSSLRRSRFEPKI